jgi:phosphoribosylformylglycinamidine (FGAM) synthase PurS component
VVHEVELSVRLKIPDVTALTAANAVRRRLGYADRLVELRRADHYVFGVEAPSVEAAEALVREMAQRTSLFVNPNKHVFETRAAGAPGPPADGGVYEVRCLVRDADFDPGPGILARLQKLSYGEAVRCVRAGTMWTLKLRADDADQALAMGRDIAVTRSRSQGLFANPHYQTCEVF